MKYSLSVLAAVLVLSGCDSTPQLTSDNLIASSIANPDRSDVDRERDARSHPEVILDLLDINTGDVVADVLGGGGYYTELIAGVVGPDGEAILQNNTPYAKFVKQQLQERYIDTTVPGIRVLFSEVDDLQLEPGSLDAVLMVMSFHDLYYYNPERGWLNTDVPLFLAQLYAALKPGARLVIVDHAALPDTGKSAVEATHRIDEVFVQQEFEGAGFSFVASSNVLRNPDDDKTKLVFDKSVRGHTDRFVLAFKK